MLKKMLFIGFCILFAISSPGLVIAETGQFDEIDTRSDLSELWQGDSQHYSEVVEDRILLFEDNSF